MGIALKKNRASSAKNRWEREGAALAILIPWISFVICVAHSFVESVSIHKMNRYGESVVVQLKG